MGQVDFAETTEMEVQKENNHTSYSTASRKFVHSWLGCYMLGRGETEFSSCAMYLTVQSISSPFEHYVFCSVLEYQWLVLPVGGVSRNYTPEYTAIYTSLVI